MGQKVSPHGLRVGVIKDWDSKWYADKNKFADYLVEDNQVRNFVKKKLYIINKKILILFIDTIIRMLTIIQIVF